MPRQISEIDDPARAADVPVQLLRNAIRRITGEPLESPSYVDLVSFANAGDLDADGSDDSLETRFLAAEDQVPVADDGDYSYRILARRHTDGRPLWTLNGLDGAGAMPAGNLDGQGGDDVVIFEGAGEQQTLATDETFIGAGGWATSIRGTRGSDGQLIWATTVPELFAVVWGEETEAVVFGGAYPAAQPTDLDGDRSPDLLLAVFAGPYVADWSAGEYVDQVRVAFVALSGRTGTPIGVFPGSLAGAHATATIVPDLTNDDTADVVVVSSGEDPQAPSTLTTRAYRGTGGEAVWQSTVDAGGAFFYDVRGAGLDGDGRGDVLLELIREGCEEDYCFMVSADLLAVSGASGARMWGHRLGPATSWHLAGDGNGDGGHELFLMTGDEDWEFGSFFSGSAAAPARLPDLMVVRGSNGSPIWGRNVRRLVDLQLAGDVTGDGVQDAVVEFRKRVKRTNPKEGQSRYRSIPMMAVYSGRSGRVAWQRRLKADAVLPILGDVNGDRRDDLRLVDYAWIDRYRAISGGSGNPLWPGWVRATGYWYDLTFARVGARGGLFESGYFGFDEDDEGTEGIYTSARFGDTGAHRWWDGIQAS